MLKCEAYRTALYNEQQAISIRLQVLSAEYLKAYTNSEIQSQNLFEYDPVQLGCLFDKKGLSGKEKALSRSTSLSGRLLCSITHLQNQTLNFQLSDSPGESVMTKDIRSATMRGRDMTMT